MKESLLEEISLVKQQVYGLIESKQIIMTRKVLEASDLLVGN